MTPAERNSVIDECLAMVRSYDQRAHHVLRVKHILNPLAPAIAQNTEDVIIQGLQGLKTKPPLRIKVLVAKAVEVECIDIELTVEAEDEHG